MIARATCCGSLDRNTHHSIGALFEADSPAEHAKPYAPGEAFDLLVHVAKTTASRPVMDR